LQTAAIAKILSERVTSIAVAERIDYAWDMAREINRNLNVFNPIPSEIELVKRYLQTEISPNFELIDMLSRGVGVHHFSSEPFACLDDIVGQLSRGFLYR
jgi:hypothetical protein